MTRPSKAGCGIAVSDATDAARGVHRAELLWGDVLGTQLIATRSAVYGVFMTPLGWGWAGLVWGYARVGFVVNDRVKLLAYRLLERIDEHRGATPRCFT